MRVLTHDFGEALALIGVAAYTLIFLFVVAMLLYGIYVLAGG
jgi:hypothetical protein